MSKRGMGVVAAVVLGQALWAGPGLAVGQVKSNPGKNAPTKKLETPSTADLPLDKLSAADRRSVFQVIDKPALAAKGPTETFYGRAEHYGWLLENPNRAVSAWRRLGAKCVSIEARGQGHFGWVDEHGSEIVWRTVHNNAGLRLWYAEGKVKPAALMPFCPVKALVVLRYSSTVAPDGAPVVQHQSDVFVNTDSKTAVLMTRMLGPTAQRAAEQGLEQLQFFFSGLCWHLERHPEDVEALLKAE